MDKNKAGTNGPGYEGSKRRRWSSGGNSANAKNDSSAAASRGRDLEEITRSRGDDGYGYPSSDSDIDGTRNYHRSSSSSCLSINGNGRAKSRQCGRARKEQRLGMRTFRNAEKENSADCDATAGTGKGITVANDALPTPRGWASSTAATANAAATPRDETNHKIASCPSTDISKGSGFTLSSRSNNNNPYTAKKSSLLAQQTTPRTSFSQRPVKPRTTHHITIAVSENLARETCVASIDAGRPTYLHITKQSNGQTYAETLALLRMINPDEILLNEGRRNSQLVKKIVEMFCPGDEEMMLMGGGGSMASNVLGRKKKKNSSKKRRGKSSRYGSRANRGQAVTGGLDDPGGDDDNDACETATVVKFVPRSYFDQTKGAELLRKLARENTYNASIVEEYILLSSSHAVLQYAQLCLGAGLTRGCLTLDVNVGGNHRMSMDRASMANLELLANSKTGRTANSLVGTIDCTKTSVGGRLLRTNLMAPPTRLDTINARLDLVDSLLEDEEFFYAVMEHLEDLPDVDKMLSYIALAPRKKQHGGNGALFGNTESPTVTTRMASKGISALVCIKSTLSGIPSFAHVLEVQLKELDEREQTAGSTSTENRNQRETARHHNERSIHREEDESTTVVESETSRQDGDINTVDLSNQGGIDHNTTTSPNSSLQIGLGTSSSVDCTHTGSPATGRHYRHQLLRAILIAMKQPALSRILDAVTGIFTESTTYSKNSHAMRHQECFALKPNTDGMMDVLRKAFLANVDDIYRLADEYAETYDINVQVKETTSRGYYLAVSAELGLDLPQIFIQPVKNGRFIYCTTEEVYSLNSRAQENVQDLLLMTHERIQDVLRLAREHYDCIASLADAIALLDLCHCFADNVASSRMPCCRPVLSDHGQTSNIGDAIVGGGGAIAIRNGRYAIDISSTGLSATGGDFIPNDTYSSALQNFTVITGINGSGKSTYLKQIALIVILAHCGSYVPADEAFIPVRDQICTRIGTSDDQEHNISTFLLEMKETALICNSSTDRSLFLLDELGRATSNEDGVALAWAVSEHLLTKRAMTFFVTHYPQLSKLADVYPNVQNQHLGSQIQSNGDTSMINYTHKIMPGPCTSTGDYGVDMAVKCGWPEDVVRNARRIQKEVKRLMPGEEICYNEMNSDNFAENRRKAHNILCDIAKHLAAMKEGEGRLTNEAKKHYLQDLRLRLVPTNDDSLVRTIRNLLLNVDDCAPSIPLPRPNQVINVAHAASGRNTTAANEEATVMGEAFMGVSSENKTAAATAQQRDEELSSSRSTESSSSSRMATELLKSRPERDSSAVGQSQPMIHWSGPLTGVCRQEEPLEITPATKKQASPSESSGMSSSSSDDDSVSSSSSDSNSDTCSSSSSSSSSE